MFRAGDNWLWRSTSTSSVILGLSFGFVSGVLRSTLEITAQVMDKEWLGDTLSGKDR